MSKEYDNTNRGVLFPNTYKNKPNQPDVRGDLNIRGVEFKLAGWVREKDGTRYFSLTAENKDEEPEVSSQDPVGQVMGESSPMPNKYPLSTDEIKLPDSSGAGEEDVPF